MTDQANFVRDPVCGMQVDPARAAAKVEHGGKTFYFCSAGCAKKFAESPDKYLSGKQVHGSSEMEAPQNASVEYTCPMHPEVLETVRAGENPPPCPDCGMALDPVSIDATQSATKTEYVCPMHPEVVRDAPGHCPICGMALEPRTATLAQAPNAELISMTRRFWAGVALTTPV